MYMCRIRSPVMFVAHPFPSAKSNTAITILVFENCGSNRALFLSNDGLLLGSVADNGPTLIQCIMSAG